MSDITIRKYDTDYIVDVDELCHIMEFVNFLEQWYKLHQQVTLYNMEDKDRKIDKRLSGHGIATTLPDSRDLLIITNFDFNKIMSLENWNISDPKYKQCHYRKWDTKTNKWVFSDNYKMVEVADKYMLADISPKDILKMLIKNIKLIKELSTWDRIHLITEEIIVLECSDD